MQIAGFGEKGLTTISMHEQATWPAVAGTPVALPNPVIRDLPTLLAYVKRIRDRRRE